jgi:hypothetical protein
MPSAGQLRPRFAASDHAAGSALRSARFYPAMVAEVAVEPAWLRCWRHVHVESEGFGVGVVVPGIAFLGEGDGGQAVAFGILASGGAAARACSISGISCKLRAEPRCHGMKTFIELASAPSHLPAPFTDQLRLAVTAQPARFKGSSRAHTETDLRCYLAWCAERRLDPLPAYRPHPELYIRWMQEIRRFRPPTVSRRFSVTAGFYRTCVIDGIWSISPPSMCAAPPSLRSHRPWGSLTPQFQALLTAARESPNLYDFALVAMPGAARLADLRSHWRRHR